VQKAVTLQLHHWCHDIPSILTKTVKYLSR